MEDGSGAGVDFALPRMNAVATVMSLKKIWAAAAQPSFGGAAVLFTPPPPLRVEADARKLSAGSRSPGRHKLTVLRLTSQGPTRNGEYAVLPY